MKIKYNRRLIKSYLIIGIGAVLSSTGIMVFNNPHSVYVTAWLFFGVFIVLWSVYRLLTPYMIIESDLIRKPGTSGAQIKLKEIMSVTRSSSGVILLNSASSKLKIDPRSIDRKNIDDFQKVINNLDVAIK